LVWDASGDLSFDLKAGYSEVSGGAINFNAAFAIPTFVSIFGSPTFNPDYALGIVVRRKKAKKTRAFEGLFGDAIVTLC